jgi:4-hydroxybenzoate-CoA ligase
MNEPNLTLYNAVDDLLDCHLKTEIASKVAFIDADKSISYRELASETNRLANLLVNNGIERNDRIALLAYDTVEWPTIFLGSIRAGVIPVALNTLLSASQYEYILRDCQAKSLFVSEALLALVEPILSTLPDLESVFVISESDQRYVSFSRAMTQQPVTFETVKTSISDIAFFLYSSGSTGSPKGLPHHHLSLISTAKTYGKSVLKITVDDVVFSAAKLFFAYGLGNSLSFPMSVGATSILFPLRPSPESVLDILERYKPTLFFAVPSLYAAIVNSADSVFGNLKNHLRLCLSAGEALPKIIGEQWAELTGIDVIDGVGSTELLHIFLSNTPDDVIYGCSGKAVPGYSLRLVTDNDCAAATDEIGELLVQGPSTAIGYWNQADRTESTFFDGWVRTGDQYTQDNAGYYYYLGRIDDMFKVNGLWVSPTEIESVLFEHELVIEAAVVPFKDRDELTKSKAYVVIKINQATGDNNAAENYEFDLLRQELTELTKHKLGKWQYPRQIEFVNELPKTATGKIQRYKLQ